MAITHVFAGNPFDRGDALRRDETALGQLFAAASTCVLPLHNLNVLVGRGDQVRLGWVPGDRLAALRLEPPPVFLGLRDGVAHFAQDVSALGDPLHELGLDESLGFQDARMAAMALDIASTGIVAQARAQIDWHRRHRYCSVCGSASTPAKGGHVRRCGSCGAEHFPRTDPVAIMVIGDGERCLLGQSAGPLARSGMYSALAGFIDQGESIEEAVRREIREEAGVTVGDVHYHSSQPWPFPSSLMIGCLGTAIDNTITIDQEEMVDVRWFERADVLAALAGTHPTLKLPGAMAIAHHLIRGWAEGPTRHVAG